MCELWFLVVLLLLFVVASLAGRGGEGRGLVEEQLDFLGRMPAGSAGGVPRSVLAGCSSSGVLDAEDGGSFSCFSSSTPSESGGARFQGVRGVSPAVVVQRSSSRRPCARRVSPLVHQMMLPWSLGVGFVRFAAPDLLFLCLFSGLCGVGRLVVLVMLTFVI